MPLWNYTKEYVKMSVIPPKLIKIGGKMGKIITCIIMVISAANICIAAELELSDVIKDAIKSENLKLSQEKETFESVHPVKNETMPLNGEQSACEKINPQELLPQKTVNN